MEYFWRNSNDFLSRLVTMDEIGYITMNRRQESMEWQHNGSPRPKKFQVQKSAGKVVAMIFCDQDNIVLIHYLPKGNLATHKKLAYLGFQCLDLPLCSPDLAPSYYHLFPGLKKQLNGHHFLSDVEVIAAAETWLDGQPSEFFLSGL